MKKIVTILALVLSLFVFCQDFKSPVDYLSYIGKEQEIISKSTWKYTKAIAHSKSARRIDNTRKQLVKTMDMAIQKISGLKNGYQGDVQYRDEVLKYINLVRSSINDECDKIIDMQEVAEKSYDFMEAYIMARDKVNEKLDIAFEEVSLAQKNYALKYKIQLLDNESELGKKMKISNQIFDYHTDIYLIFFKSNITDNFLTQAIQAKDMNAIQQHASALAAYSKEGLEKLKTKAAYNKDESMIKITQKALEYYNDVAEKFVPNTINFLMLQEKFTVAKNNLESKSKRDITDAEIESYNQLVKQLNKETQIYNNAINANNIAKTNAINNWNNTSEIFISKHVPQD